MTFDDDKSTSLCHKCMGKIKTWRKQVEHAGRCQYIVDYLDKVVCRQIFISLFILMLTLSLLQKYHYVPVFFNFAIFNNYTILRNPFSHYFKLK